MSDITGGRFPIERPVALSGRPVPTRSARPLHSGKTCFQSGAPLGGHQPEAPAKRGNRDFRVSRRQPLGPSLLFAETRAHTGGRRTAEMPRHSGRPAAPISPAYVAIEWRGRPPGSESFAAIHSQAEPPRASCIGTAVVHCLFLRGSLCSASRQPLTKLRQTQLEELRPQPRIDHNRLRYVDMLLAIELEPAGCDASSKIRSIRCRTATAPASPSSSSNSSLNARAHRIDASSCL